ncbi:helix-turn-helix transcriptional regulator [Pseudonocardia sp. TRM90224]|uniref:helix-turn-helix transcriptional regulator n=1 Tax=Pseudonocardia sp. TRM90224 TaxID=2812678 RepID=UPI001E2C166F|nr:YafY family protein [Pseudonocardia sp. TRM90224]
MTDTPGRLLSLLSLLQMPREWPGSELARRLEVSPRTIRRDVDRLRDLGYPVEASRGSIGGYRLVAGAAMPPLLLDDDEAVAIVVGLRTAAGQAVAGIDEASMRALAKLEQVLPSRLRYRVGALGAATTTMPIEGPAVEPEVLSALAAAITNRERARFRYSTHEGAQAARHVEPYRLVTAGRRWYLVAFDLDRDAWRSFRADRITDARGTGARTTPRELPGQHDGDAAAYLQTSMYTSAPTYSADVTVHAPAATVVGRLGDTPQDVVAIDDTSCRVHRHTDTLPWIGSKLVALGCDFEVHGPPEVVEHLRLLIRRLQAGVR